MTAGTLNLRNDGFWEVLGDFGLSAVVLGVSDWDSKIEREYMLVFCNALPILMGKKQAETISTSG